MATLFGRLRLFSQEPSEFPDGSAWKLLQQDLSRPLAFILREDPRPIGYPIQLQRILLKDAAAVADRVLRKPYYCVHSPDDVAATTIVVHKVMPVLWVALSGMGNQDERRWFNDRLQMGNHLLHGGAVILLPAMRLAECIDDYNDWLDRCEGRRKEPEMVRIGNVERMGVQ